MELILWRHAEAEDGFPDMKRRLTAKGEKQAAKMAAFLKPRLPSHLRIIVSPAVRTQQTIQPLTTHFETVQEIAPGSDRRTVLAAIGWPDAAGAVLVVGHQPYLGEVAGWLLTGKEQGFSVKKGAIWWLDGREGSSPATLKLSITPELA